MFDYEAILAEIVRDPRYAKNLDWGVPRHGHPEGSIRNHIADLEANLAVLRPKLSDVDCWKLRLLIHTHDTFKPDAELNIPIIHPRSHSSLARAFLAEYCPDPDLLAIVQFHDEPYALWRQLKHRGKYDQGRMDALLRNIRDWNLYLAFIIIDGCTAGKGREPLYWLFDQVDGKVQSSFTAADIR
ncbi:MAG TPA: hypothetical protein VF175_16455 [Lacipirellula sp.]